MLFIPVHLVVVLSIDAISFRALGNTENLCATSNAHISSRHCEDLVEITYGF